MNVAMAQRLVVLSLGVLIFLPACTGQRTTDHAQAVFEPPAIVLAGENQRALQANPEASPGQSLPAGSLTATLPPPSNTPIATQLNQSQDSGLLAATATLTLLPSSSPTWLATETPTPSATLLPSATASASPAPTELPTMTPLPPPGVIIGQILLNGAPLDQPVTLALENQAYQPIQEITFSNGELYFENIPASFEGYNILFSRDKNPHFNPNAVINWAWVGPIVVQDGDVTRLADMEIGALGLQPIFPQQDAILNLDSITAQNPLVFEWRPYPSASGYWIDLRSGSTLNLIWQSVFSDSNTIAFDGILANGEPIPPGSYWWNVSARVEDNFMTISGGLAGFSLNP